MNRRLIIVATVVCAALLLISQYWLKPEVSVSSPVISSSKAEAVEPSNTGKTPQQDHATSYVGSAQCASCHNEQQQLWQGSHHQQAMQHASAATVKGDFDDQHLFVLEQDHHFFTRDDAYYVRTGGADGKATEYQVLYTLATEPLQQYIVAFPSGRLQMLPMAWDTLRNKWFHLQAEQKPIPGEWIHWTQGGMNWNSMCADCHTTHSQKNFTAQDNSYATTWSDINVGCESCHGPGQAHVEAHVQNLPVKSNLLDMNGSDSPTVVVEKCARCHSRRQQLTEVYQHNSDQFLDHYMPEVLRQGLYSSDGQILDEVFVYGSFVQSKMYQSGISCSNCHDPHSNKLKQSDNKLCTSCHASDQYDAPTHHHHPSAADLSFESNESRTGSGNFCVDCHMPGKVYMGNDFRRDHSLRIPRPDLSVSQQTPNACNDCHTDKTALWASTAVEQWFGESRPAHFSEVLALAANDPQRAIIPLLKLLQDVTQPAIARATAAQILTPLAFQPNILKALNISLSDTSPLLRAVIAHSFYTLPLALKQPVLVPLLNDPVRAVRVAAARALVEIKTEQLSLEQQRWFTLASAEYQTSLAMNIDFPSGNHQQAMDFDKLGQLDQASKFLQNALAIDDRNNASRMNLAHIYYRQQRSGEAEALYRKVLEQEPNTAPALYALGLLRAELGDTKQAQEFLQQAALSGGNPRAWYNLAILRQQQQQYDGAIKAYKNALQIVPGEPQFVQGLVSLYVQQQNWKKAFGIIEQALIQSPTNQQLSQLRRAVLQAQQQSP